MAEILCPEDCEVALPVQKFDECNPEINKSQITDIFYTKGNATPFTDVTDPVEWAARLSQTDVASPDSIRRLTGIGSKAKPTSTTRAISGGRTVTINRAHSINHVIDETNQENHDAMRNHQCRGTYTMWYKAGNLIFGGNSGIKVTFDPGAVLDGGDEGVIVLDYVITWNNLFDEERAISPI